MGVKSIRIPVLVKAAHYTTKKVPNPILIIKISTFLQGSTVPIFEIKSFWTFSDDLRGELSDHFVHLQLANTEYKASLRCSVIFHNPLAH